MNALAALRRPDAARWAHDVLHAEAQALAGLAANPPLQIDAAARRLAAAQGPVLCCGAGKSGLVAAKTAATLTSLGTPAFVLSAMDAAHGDLGAVLPDTTLLLFSNSGTTAEILRIVPSLRARRCCLIALVGRADTPLGRAADIVLELPIAREADHLGLAPTASTIVQMAAGDALAVAASRLRGFAETAFWQSHPAGQLGRRALPVGAVMRIGAALPTVTPAMTLAETASVMSSGRIGAACVIDADTRLLGLVVDGDIRRAVEARHDLYTVTAGAIMRPDPVLLTAEACLGEAIDLIHARRIQVLPVCDPGGTLCGVLYGADL